MQSIKTLSTTPKQKRQPIGTFESYSKIGTDHTPNWMQYNNMIIPYHIKWCTVATKPIIPKNYKKIIVQMPLYSP